MDQEVGLIVFMVTVVGISLSGVMAPGPITAATIAEGMRSRHAGGWVAVGHAVVELPLMLLLVVGVGQVFEQHAVRVTIALIGGVFLLWFGVRMLMAIKRQQDAGPPPAHRHPFWAGVILTGANPYFLLWWATIGLEMITRAVEFGAAVFVLFAIVHWLCDLVWYEVLSWASFGGSRLLAGRGAKWVLAVCGAVMLAFGVMFLYDGGSRLLTGTEPTDHPPPEAAEPGASPSSAVTWATTDLPSAARS